MGSESNIINTIGIILEIIGIMILLTGASRLELKEGPFAADYYVDAKTKKQPKVLTLPNDKRTKISIIVAIIGLFLQIAATWMIS